MSVEAQPQNSLKTKLSTEQSNVSHPAGAERQGRGAGHQGSRPREAGRLVALKGTSSSDQVAVTVRATAAPSSLSLTVKQTATPPRITFGQMSGGAVVSSVRSCSPRAGRTTP